MVNMLKHRLSVMVSAIAQAIVYGMLPLSLASRLLFSALLYCGLDDCQTLIPSPAYMKDAWDKNCLYRCSHDIDFFSGFLTKQPIAASLKINCQMNHFCSVVTDIGELPAGTGEAPRFVLFEIQSTEQSTIIPSQLADKLKYQELNSGLKAPMAFVLPGIVYADKVKKCIWNTSEVTTKKIAEYAFEMQVSFFSVQTEITASQGSGFLIVREERGWPTLPVALDWIKKHHVSHCAIYYQNWWIETPLDQLFNGTKLLDEITIRKYLASLKQTQKKTADGSRGETCLQPLNTFITCRKQTDTATESLTTWLQDKFFRTAHPGACMKKQFILKSNGSKGLFGSNYKTMEGNKLFTCSTAKQLLDNISRETLSEKLDEYDLVILQEARNDLYYARVQSIIEKEKAASLSLFRIPTDGNLIDSHDSHRYASTACQGDDTALPEAILAEVTRINCFREWYFNYLLLGNSGKKSDEKSGKNYQGFQKEVSLLRQHITKSTSPISIPSHETEIFQKFKDYKHVREEAKKLIYSYLTATTAAIVKDLKKYQLVFCDQESRALEQAVSLSLLMVAIRSLLYFPSARPSFISKPDNNSCDEKLIYIPLQTNWHKSSGRPYKYTGQGSWSN